MDKRVLKDIQALALRQFTLDDEPINILEFITDNDFDAAEIKNIKLLNVGHSIQYGGGAAATFILTRTA